MIDLVKRVHFIGGGQMSEAIIRAMLTNDADKQLITVTDIDQKRNEYLTGRYGVKANEYGMTGLAEADLIVIGVRPQDDLSTVSRTIIEQAKEKATIVSIVAGVTLVQLENWLGKNRPIVRVIPNTLTDTGLGFSGVALNEHASKEAVEPFLTSFGKVKYIDEKLIDAFTGYGVAGPNYVYYFIESFVDAGVLAGLPRDLAFEVALENLVGAVDMLKHSGKHPRQLLDINNSPAGVGIHAIHQLNSSDFAAGLQRSVLTAVNRTTELANE
ncbi:pyrroline-5-carboxylate reductase family protein [Amphibacillus sp. Q70]|uniref:pyrroline-5-carboxylate reductase family protein n=1 Tax=Amphibacillus sp. Q70 TaxID=3453416 RepID=UPI003F837198